MPNDYDYTGIDNANGIIQEKILMPSTIETIDTAFFNYINERFNPSAETNEGFKKVPVLWLSAERAHQIKNNPELRDEKGFFKFPIITIERKSLTKEKDFKGSFQAHIPDGPGPKRVNVPIARRIVQDRTQAFANAGAKKSNARGLNGDPNRLRNNNKVVYQTVYAPIPVYVKSTYTAKIITDYQEQMNEMITPFLTRTGQINLIAIEADGHRYETFIDGNFSTSNNTGDLGENIREFSTEITFNVLGYLMGEGLNDEKPKISVVENYVEVKVPREHVMVGDINTYIKKSFYRE